MAEIKKNETIKLKKIKSSYIMKEILCFLKEKQRLNIIIYNKHLQNLFGFDVDCLKKITGKYKVDGKNGIGKEYKLDTNELIFEGEYLNGKRNGKGKEYFFNNGRSILIFEGEYLNGKRNGKGKEYFNNSKLILIFEGEYLNGQRYGKGKEYFFNGELSFEGEYLNGKKWNGKGYNNDGILEFQIKNGSGIIKEYNYYGKLIFVGEYLNG